MTSGAELATLVETEQRLDEVVASARSAGEAIREAARERARRAMGELERSIEAERARIARTTEEEVAERVRVIEREASRRIASFATMVGDELARVADQLARRVVELSSEEP